MPRASRIARINPFSCTVYGRLIPYACSAVNLRDEDRSSPDRRKDPRTRRPTSTTQAVCESAWNIDPFRGVIGVEY